MTVNELKVDTVEWLVKCMCEYMVESSTEQTSVETKNGHQTDCFCHCLILALHFCNGQFLCITGGFVMFFMQDSQNHKNLVPQTGLHFIQVLLKQELLSCNS